MIIIVPGGRGVLFFPHERREGGDPAPATAGGCGQTGRLWANSGPDGGSPGGGDRSFARSGARGMRGVFGGLATVVLAAVACGAGETPEFARHAVVSQEGHASDIGRDVLRRGGNAVDAAVATAFALAVTHPAAGNLGGGGFLVAFLADRGTVVTVDFREVAPKAAGPRMYLGDDGRLLPRHRAGARAAGVPGTVRGLGLSQERFGRAPWADLVRPAALLAREGFPVSATLARSLNQQLFRPGRVEPGGRDDLGTGSHRLADFPETVAALGKSDGTPWRAGDRLVQRDLADTLDRIADGGPDEFYTGRTARLLADYMAGHGGLVTRDDLAAYRARERAPTHVTFRGYDVYGVGPPASGGIVVGLMLNILERYDLKADGPRRRGRCTASPRRCGGPSSSAPPRSPTRRSSPSRSGG